MQQQLPPVHLSIYLIAKLLLPQPKLWLTKKIKTDLCLAEGLLPR